MSTSGQQKFAPPPLFEILNTPLQAFAVLLTRIGVALGISLADNVFTIDNSKIFQIGSCVFNSTADSQGRIQGDSGDASPTSSNHLIKFFLKFIRIHYTVHTLHIAYTQILTPCKVKVIKLSITLYICNKVDISSQLSSSYSDSHRLPRLTGCT